MAKSILQYDVRLEGPTILEISSDTILNAIYRKGRVAIYALVDEKQKSETYEFWIFKAGQEMDDSIGNFEFLKTVKIEDNKSVHVFFNRLSGENGEINTVVSLPLEFHNKDGQVEYVEMVREMRRPKTGWENKKHLEIEGIYARVEAYEAKAFLNKETLSLEKIVHEKGTEIHRNLENKGWRVVTNYAKDYSHIWPKLWKEIEALIFGNQAFHMREFEQRHFERARKAIIDLYYKAQCFSDNNSRRYIEFQNLLEAESRHWSDVRSYRRILIFNVLNEFGRTLHERYKPKTIDLLG